MDDATPDYTTSDSTARDTAVPAGPVRHGRGPAPTGRMVTRRRVLVSSAVVVAAAGAGVAEAAVWPRPKPAPPAPTPRPILEALSTERNLIAALSASAVTDPSTRALLTQLADDHRAHERAITGLLDDYPGAAARVQAGAGVARTRDQLRGAERQATAVTARRAGALTGPAATLFASIAACEAAHAELLT